MSDTMFIPESEKLAIESQSPWLVVQNRLDHSIYT